MDTPTETKSPVHNGTVGFPSSSGKSFNGYFDRVFEAFGAPWQARPVLTPTLIPARVLSRCDYFRSFPNNVTFASHLVSKGTSLQIVGKLIGHTQASTTMRYAHLSDGALRDAANDFGKIFDGAKPVLQVVPQRKDARRKRVAGG